MKILLDQGWPRGAALALRQLGFDVVHTADMGMSKAADESILAWAPENEHVIVTLDSDFHVLLAVSGANSPSVIRIRVEGLRADALAQLVHQVLTMCPSDLQKGAMITVNERNLRVHSLPIAR